MFDHRLNDKIVDRDWELIAATLGLIIIGALFVLSASGAGGGSAAVWYKQIYTKQVVF